MPHSYKVWKTYRYRNFLASYNSKTGDYWHKRKETIYEIIRSDGHKFTKDSGNYANWKKAKKAKGAKIVLMKD